MYLITLDKTAFEIVEHQQGSKTWCICMLKIKDLVHDCIEHAQCKGSNAALLGLKDDIKLPGPALPCIVFILLGI